MAAPTVLAVVLSFNGTSDTLECLESLVRQTCPNLSILVVDNASTDGAQRAISEHFPEIEIVALPKNRGWAGGNNVGIEIAKERGIDLVCLLNNDLVLSIDAIERMTIAYQDLGACMLHPGIYFHRNPEVAQLDPSVNGPTEKRMLTAGGHEVWKMDHAYGACLMVSTEIFCQVGLFDERFFLQLEETDFFMRAHRFGFHALCLPSARILHKESVAFGGVRTPMKTYYSVRNQLLLTEKHCAPGSGNFKISMKRIYWQLRSLHQKVASGNFIVWLISSDLYASATRRAVYDYLMRRFDMINARSAKAIAVK